MSRYIDADELRKTLWKFAPKPARHSGKDVLAGICLSIEEIVNATPLADVVEVVRCKDCRYHCRPYAPLDRSLYCGYGGSTSWHDGDEEFYCGHGERIGETG